MPHTSSHTYSCSGTDILYATVRTSISMLDVLNHYNIAVRNHVASCPFHVDNTPSLRVYPDSFYCFGCGAGGDVINFVARILNIKNREAVQILASEFHLNISTSSFSDSASEAARIAHSNFLYEKQFQKSFSQWEKQSFLVLSAYFRQLRADFTHYTPIDSNNSLHPYFTESLQNFETISYWLDILREGDFQSKLIFYKTMRNEVKKLAAKIRLENRTSLESNFSRPDQ